MFLVVADETNISIIRIYVWHDIPVDNLNKTNCFRDFLQLTSMAMMTWRQTSRQAQLLT